MDDEKSDDSKKRIPSISIESQEVYRRLEQCEVGEIIGYAEFSHLAMGSIQGDKRFALDTARDRILHEKGYVFECVPTVGVKRLNDSEIVKLGEAVVGKIHRAANRGLRKLACIEYEKLTNKEQINFNARFSCLGALHHVTKPRQIKRLEAAVNKAQARLQIQETLDAFDPSERGDTFPPKLTIVKEKAG